jgi:hypothetical protein
MNLEVALHQTGAAYFTIDVIEILCPLSVLMTISKLIDLKFLGVLFLLSLRCISFFASIKEFGKY